MSAEADIAAVENAIVNLVKAMIAADRAQLDALTADGLSYGHSSGLVETKAQFIDNVMSKATIFKAIDLSDASVAISGGNAIARHMFSASLETGGKPHSVTIGVLQVWTKQDGRWRILARQAFKF